VSMIKPGEPPSTASPADTRAAAADFPSVPLARALASALQALQGSAARVAAAVSGGADSAMLAAHAAPLALERGIALQIFHVHHGLQAAADEWTDNVREL